MADHNSCQREQCCFSGVSYSFRLFLKNIDDKVRRTYVILLLCCFSGSVWGQDAKENSQLVKAEQLEVFADSCYNAGNISSAIESLSRSAKIRKEIQGSDNEHYSDLLSILALFYSELDNYAEAVRLGTEAMKIRKKVLGNDHRDYATSLALLAIFYSDLGNYPEAIRLCTEAMEIRKKVLGNDHRDYASSLNDLAIYYSDLGNYPEAIRLCTEAMEILKKVLGNDHPDYASSLRNLAIYNNKLGNHPCAYILSSNSISYSQSTILNSFAELSSELQEALWNKKGNAYSFCCLFPSFVYRYQTRESVSELYDKTALFAKGILQNSCISMRKLILESNDPMLLSKYDELTTNVSIYNKLIEKPFMERCLDTDSLRSIIHQQGMELARESKAYGDYAKNLRINWKDVQQCLSNNDIAIEFLSFPVSEDSVMYVALTLKKGSDVPQMTPLFDERQLKQVLDTLYFQCADMTDLVWKPLQSELQGVRNIYFSPSGTLYNIGIEYLPGMENYNIYRLSSTRELVTRKNTESDNRAVLYGGLDYYANFDKKSNTSSLIEEYVEHQGRGRGRERGRQGTERGALAGAARRGGVVRRVAGRGQRRAVRAGAVAPRNQRRLPARSGRDAPQRDDRDARRQLQAEPPRVPWIARGLRRAGGS